jgi:hypothetical protein
MGFEVAMNTLLILWLLLVGSVARSDQSVQVQTAPQADLEKSAYFAFVDRDFILTVEIVGPGIALLNFVSMAEDARVLSAKLIRVRLENRTAVPRFFVIDTGDPKQPMTAPSVNMRPRSSFGVRLQGDFEEAKEFYGVTIGIADEDLRLVPLSSLAFENLVLKVNRINLGSPDFRDDWQALKLEIVGTRSPARKK